MFLLGYFYWCGVVINAMAVLCVLAGVICSIRGFIIDTKMKQKYAVKEIEDEKIS